MFLLAIKKLISRLLFPIPICLELLILGLILIWFFPKQQKKGKIIITTATILLIIFSSTWSSQQLLHPLEYHYPAQIQTTKNNPNITYVAVLGSNWEKDPKLPVTSQISEHFISRILEAVRLYQQAPNRKILISIAGIRSPQEKEETIQQLCKILNIEYKNIELITEALDTVDEAKLMKKIIKDKPFILVTTASHIPRAMAIFKKQQMNPIPAPCGHYCKKKDKFHPSTLYPNAQAMRNSERAIYEYLGLLWGKISGNL